jgi:hypothetical protein
VSRRCRRLVVLLAFGLLAQSPAVSADGQRLVWNQDWPRFRPVEYGATGLLVAAGLVLELASTQPDDAHWIGPLPLDQSIRSLLVGGSRPTRQVADFASDIGWMTAQLYPQAIDAVLVTYALDGGNLDVAWQLSWMNAETMAVGFLLTRGSHRLFARERPLSALASATGVLRIVADRHYASDVIVGAVMGLSVGYGLPWLLHYCYARF